jgi:putative SOS response-associated peptidase YedK
LWTSNRKATGSAVLSFTVLTINADDHSLFNQFHKPQDEKRMVVVMVEDQYDEWLKAPAGRSMDFMRQYPPEALVAASNLGLGL